MFYVVVWLPGTFAGAVDFFSVLKYVHQAIAPGRFMKWTLCRLASQPATQPAS